MRNLWNSFKIAFAMFSKIPMPQADWTKENMKYMFCFFPFIGTVIGLLTAGVARYASGTNFSKTFVVVVLMLIPVLVTGGIHIDGLLDTSDAMSSWQSKERRLEILKDSNAGAFAVITACVYFLCWFGAYSQICDNFTAISIMSVGFMTSRCFSGIGVVTIPKAKESGTVAEFSRKAEDILVRNVLIVYLVLLMTLMIWIHPIAGSIVSISEIMIYIYYYRSAMKYFGGTTGDLAGCFLCLCETGTAIILAILSGFGGI